MALNLSFFCCAIYIKIESNSAEIKLRTQEVANDLSQAGLEFIEVYKALTVASVRP